MDNRPIPFSKVFEDIADYMDSLEKNGYRIDRVEIQGARAGTPIEYTFHLNLNTETPETDAL